MKSNLIPVANPHANYLTHATEIDAAIKSVLNSARYILGQQTQAFEANFATYIGVKHAVGVNSGTDAIVLALRALDIKAGDEVITVSHTAVATVAAIELVNARPVFCDINPQTRCMDAEKLESLITEKTKAILVVHLYGHPADMLKLQAIAKKHQLLLIEDCAQAHGAKINGLMVGSFSDVSCFSFYPTKNLGAIGDGGAVLTNDDALADRLRWLREYGWKERYISYYQGMNTRLDEMQAAILNVKLPYLENEILRRNEIANRYQQALTNTNIVLPGTKPGCRHAYHLYVIETQNRQSLIQHLTQKGVASAIHYPQAVHQQPAYFGRIRGYQNLPVTEALIPTILSLPMYPELTNAMVETVIDALLSFEKQ